jgi:hypothetical protein
VTYEVSGKDTDVLVAELNRIVDVERQTLQNLRVAAAAGQSRVVFSVDCPRSEQEQLSVLFHESSVFSSVSSLGSVEHE